MPPEARLVTGLAVALALVYSATPLVIRVADRLQFYDRPIGYKGHSRPTPYLGGAAVMVGFLLALVAVSTDDRGRTLPLVAGMAVLWAVGTIDDKLNLSVRIRVLVEIGLATMLWATGLGWDLGAGGGLDLALTILWVLAVVNAFNLFDNMDGAATVMALVVSAGVVAMGAVNGDTWLAVAAATLCGACLGFLPHNLASPARIFLGDGGSMPIGFAVAALVMVGSADAVPAWQALVVGLLLVGVPALDTCLVILSRRRRGVSVLTGGRDHLTHRAQRRLRTARAVALALGAVQALVSALALFATGGGATVIVLVIVLYLVAGATAIALLEAAERDQTAVPLSTGTAVALGPRVRRRTNWATVATVVALGAGLAVSPFFGGYYDETKWLPLGLLLMVVATAAAIAQPPRLGRLAVVALASLVALATWALLSSAWAPSIVQATTEGNRTFVLAAILATALVLVQTRRTAAWLTGALAAGIGVVALAVVVRLLGSDPNTLFIAGRLHQPLGYINAMGTVFLMGFWLCFSVAERQPAWLAGAGAGAATLMAALALLTESRGAALAIIGSLLIVLVVVPGSRVRRLYALLACAAGVAAASGPLLHLYDVGVAGPITDGDAHRAGIALLLASAAVALVWGGGVFALDRLRASRPELGVQLMRAGVAVLAAGALILAAGSAASAGQISRTASDQWTTFTSLGQSPGTTSSDADTARLASGAGYRYDYWRIAVRAFEDRPLLGVGAGNYDRPYFKARRTSEDVRQPHSIELQAISELGIVGGVLLAGFFGALCVAAARARRLAARSPLSATLTLAGIGVVSTWLVHTSVDWVHLMPGISGVALAMIAVLMLSGPRPAPVPQRAEGGRLAVRPAPLAAAGAASLVLVVAAVSLSRQGLADLFRDRASDALAERPADAIREANRSLRLDAENPRTYYVKAAALARFNQAEAARQTLLRAARKEPDDFVTWTLLGDLAVRRGRIAEAARDYGRASKLNPQDPVLLTLAGDPRKALERGTP